MITNKEDYERYLSSLTNIAETAPSVFRMKRLPVDETIYQIDLNTRKVSAPPFIGVTGDHSAEFIFFEMDRYYDMMDLSETIGLILFTNANNEQYCQLIPCYDIYSVSGKIIFPWAVQVPAALYTGQVSFAFKFFKIDPTSSKLLFELNTLVAKTKVLNGYANITDSRKEYQVLNLDSIKEVIVDNQSIINNLNRILSAGEHLDLLWIDADRMPSEPTSGPYNDEVNLEPTLPDSEDNDPSQYPALPDEGNN